MGTRFIVAVLWLVAGCGGGSPAIDNPDASNGCPAGQHASNGTCIPDGVPDAMPDSMRDGQVVHETFASICNKNGNDSFMQGFVLEWSTLGLASCEEIGAFLETQTNLAFTFSATRRVGDGSQQFRPWALDNHVVEALAALPRLGSLALEGQPFITDLSPLGAMPELRLLAVADCRAHDFSFVQNLSLIGFQVENEPVDSLAPLTSQSQLTQIVLVDTHTPDLSPLAELAQLQSVIVTKNGVTSAAPLAGLTGLTRLSLNDNSVTDLTPVAGLTELVDLSMRNNQVTSAAPVANLTKLKTLTLSANRITDLSPLAGLAGLTSLAVDQNTVASFAPLANLVNLTTLNLNRTGLADLAALSANTKLATLFISDNPVTDLAALKQLAPLRVLAVERLASATTPFDVATVATLTQLRSLAISGDRLTDLAVVDRLTNLEALIASGNAIVDVTPAGKLAKLTRLELATNKITSVDALAPLLGLTTFVADNNPIDPVHCPIAPTARSPVLAAFCALRQP